MQKIKLTILHLIDSLGTGGAETLVVETIKNLIHYDHVLVYLVKPDDLKIVLPDNVRIIFLDHSKGIAALRTILRLRKVIRQMRPDIVHAHLLWSMIYARLATPKSIPLIFTVHTPLSIDAYQHNPPVRLIDKFTYRSRHIMIGVSKSVWEDYRDQIGIKGRHLVLYNFVADRFFDHQWLSRKQNGAGGPVKLVAVGSLRAVKNHQFLLEAFALLPPGIATLDIYGGGDLKVPLQQFIDQHHLPVRLMGKIQNVAAVLPEYDGYVMSSLLEGHSIAVAEAMAVGIPMILSDIPTLREGSFGHATFFGLDHPASFVTALEQFIRQDQEVIKMAAMAHEIALNNYTRKGYIQKLQDFYESVRLDYTSGKSNL